MRRFIVNVNGLTPWHFATAALAVVGAGAAGTALALTGTLFPQQQAVAEIVGTRSAAAYDCAGGGPIAELAAGQRVLVTAQTADAGWFGVRDPLRADRTLWLPAQVLTLDDPDFPLTIGGECPTVALATDTPPITAPAPDGTAQPGQPAQPAQPAADTTPPQLTGAAVSVATIACDTGYGLPTTVTVSVSATDDRGVAAVAISWDGRETGSASMTSSGSVWSYSFDPVNGGQAGTVNFRLTARDAAGNTSATATTTVYVDCLG